MTLDERTVARLGQIDRPAGPLFICDVDEVVLEFVDPFHAFLRSHGLSLATSSFRLHGNIRDADGREVEAERIDRLIDLFFDTQADWQPLVAGAKDGLELLSKHGTIFLLTAMRHGHFEARETHLAALGIHYPLVTTEGSKGAAIAHLGHEDETVFVDDLPSNHFDVLSHSPETTAIHFMANRAFADALPELPSSTRRADTWDDVVRIALEAVDRDADDLVGASKTT